MHKTSSALLALAAVAVAGGALALAPSPAPVAAVPSAVHTYRVDPVHSAILFRIKHLDVAYVYGWFREFNGSFTWDADNPSAGAISAEVQTRSIDTGNQKRDDHLRSPDFFNALQFPTATFESTSIQRAGDTTFEITGDLTISGVTKSITFPVEWTGEAETRQGYRAGFEAHVTLDRNDFGIKFMPAGLGAEVKLIVSFEGVRQ